MRITLNEILSEVSNMELSINWLKKHIPIKNELKKDPNLSIHQNCDLDEIYHSLIERQINEIIKIKSRNKVLSALMSDR